MRINRAFFARPAPVVAHDLVGAILVRQLSSGEQLRGRVVETEGYHGQDDTASHARAGKTARTTLMYGLSGYAYVYLIYGIHHMLNVTAAVEELPSAVLIRAVEPVQGIDTMMATRKVATPALTNGPGKLCQAFMIDRSLNGEDLVQSEVLWFEYGSPGSESEVACSPRIGIDYADPEDRARPWRFFLKGNRWISK